MTTTKLGNKRSHLNPVSSQLKDELDEMFWVYLAVLANEMSGLKQQSHYFIRSDSVAAVIRLPVGCTFFHITTPKLITISA